MIDIGFLIALSCSLTAPPVPTSAELIQMAKQDWINRYMRKGTLDEFSFETGWMAGFLTPNKPDWTKEHDTHTRTTERNATLDALHKSFNVSELTGNETEFELGFRQGMTHAQCTIKSLQITQNTQEQQR